MNYCCNYGDLVWSVFRRVPVIWIASMGHSIHRLGQLAQLFEQLPHELVLFAVSVMKNEKSCKLLFKKDSYHFFSLHRLSKEKFFSQHTLSPMISSSKCGIRCAGNSRYLIWRPYASSSNGAMGIGGPMRGANLGGGL